MFPADQGGDVSVGFTPELQNRAAGVLFMSEDNHILLLLRSNEGDMPDTWAIPGGKIEPGESENDAAERECMEEMAGTPQCSWDGTQSDHDGYVTFVYQADKNAPKEFAPDLNNEHKDWGWFPLDDLPKDLHPGLKYSLESLGLLPL